MVRVLGAAPVAELRERAYECRQHGVVADAVDEAAVDLDDVRGGQDDVPQRREAGPDVVDGQPHPALAQRLQHLAERRVVLDRRVLGQLQQDPLERQPSQQPAALGREQRAG